MENRGRRFGRQGPAAPPGPPAPPGAPAPLGAPAPPGLPDAPPDTSWDHVASWYDKLVGDEGSDYHRHVLLPAAMRMLDPRPGERVLDLSCGQGVRARLLARQDVTEVVAVDAGKAMIAAAKARRTSPKVCYVVADARNLGDLADGTFDAAACLMAVQDLDDVGGVFAGMAAALRVGGRAVVVMMHPCFRIPRQSSWGWDEEKKAQYRRLDRYASLLAIPIATHPGSAGGQQTVFFHRPLSAYINALGSAGLAVAACEELLSHHQSEPGGRSRGENRSRREFPVFLAFKAIKLPAP